MQDFQRARLCRTERDFAAYELSVASPIWGSYRGHRISTSPPPASGMSMLQILHMLKETSLGGLAVNLPEC